MTESPVTRATLLLRLRDGTDADAWSQFLRDYGPMLYRFARSRGLQDADASDVVEDVLRSVGTAIGRLDYEKEKGGFRAWLFTITRNRLYTFFEKRQRSGPTGNDTAQFELLSQTADDRSERDDSHVKLWDVESFELVKQWRAGNAVRQIAFSPDGRRIVAGDRDGVIHVYEIDSGDEVASQTQPGSILGIDYSADGKLIATVTSDKVVRVWYAESLDQRQTFTGHDGPIYNVAFASQGPLLATVGWGKNIRVWNVETGAEVHNLVGSEGDVWGVSFCGDGTHLVTSGQEGAAHIWDLSDGRMIATLRGHESAVHNVSLDSETRRIATSGRDGTVRIWDLSGLEQEK